MAKILGTAGTARPSKSAPKKSINARINPGTPYVPPKPSPAVSAGVKAVVAPVQHAAQAASHPIKITTKAAAQSVSSPVASTTKAIGNPFRGMGQPHHGGGLLGAIEGIPLAGAVVHSVHGALPTLGHLATNTGKDLINLGPTTLKGLEALGPALYHDTLTNLTAPFTGHHSNALPNLLLSGLKSDPIYLSIKHGSFKPILQHPLYAGLDLAGGEGALGRSLGAVSRSGRLGDRLAALASTGRSERLLAPGLAGDVRHYSPNLLHAAVQKALEDTAAQRAGRHLGALVRQPVKAVRGRALTSAEKLLQKRVDEFVPVARVAKQTALKNSEQELRAAMPEGPAAHVASHAVMGTAGAPAEFVQQLEHEILPALEREHENPLMSPAARKANEQQQANIHAFLANPDVQGAFQGAAAYHEMRIPTEAAKAHLGLRTEAEMERRALQPVALRQMPGVEMVPKVRKVKLPSGRTVTRASGVPTSRAIEAQEHLGLIRQATRDLKDAEQHRVKLKAMHGDAERAVRDAERKVARADRAEAKQAAFIQGRYGLNNELKSARAQASAGALDRRIVTTDAVNSHLQDMKSALTEARAARREEGKTRVDVAKQNLKDLKQEFTEVHKPYVGEKHHGLMIEDQGAPLIRMGKYKGRRMRPLSNDEIKAFMEQRGIPHADYIRMTVPSDEALARPRLTRGGSRGKSFTGSGIEAGAFTPGWASLTKTQLADVSQIQDALAHDQFINESGIAVPHGEDWRHFADRYQQETGIQLEALYRHPQAISVEQRAAINKLQKPGEAELASLHAREVPEDAEPAPDRVVLVPKVMMDRYREHLGLNTGTGALAGINRAFRNTVLPFSTKWLTGNVVEAGLRGTLAGANPVSHHLAGAVLDRMHELENAQHIIHGTFTPEAAEAIAREGLDPSKLVRGGGVGWAFTKGATEKGFKFGNHQVDMHLAAKNPIHANSSDFLKQAMNEHRGVATIGDALRATGHDALIDEHGTVQALPEAMRPGAPITQGSTQRLESLATGGLHYGMQERLNAEHIAQTGAADATPHMAVSTVKNVARGYTNIVQGIYKVNRKLESQAEKAVLGRHMQRQLREFGTSWAKAATTQRDYIDKLARHYADPRLAADAGRYVHDVLGQYDRFSPAMKKFISNYAPFFPWYRNALKFVYYTLPAQHPVAQALALTAARGNEAQFNQGRDVPHDKFFGMPVGDLLSAPKVGPTDYLNVGRYTPEGAFTSGPVDYALNSVAPQLQGVLYALRGQDPFGNDLAGPHGKLTDTGQRALVALNDLLLEFAGPTNQAYRVIAEHGQTPYNTSTIFNKQLKPNTHHNPLLRVFSPLEPTHLGKNRTKAVKVPNLSGYTLGGNDYTTGGKSDYTLGTK